MNDGAYLFAFDGLIGNISYNVTAAFSGLTISIMALPILILPILHTIRYFYVVK